MTKNAYKEQRGRAHPGSGRLWHYCYLEDAPLSRELILAVSDLESPSLCTSQ